MKQRLNNFEDILLMVHYGLSIRKKEKQFKFTGKVKKLQEIQASNV